VRPIHIVHLDKARPAVVLTRALVRPHLNEVAAALITTTVRGLSSEVPVGPSNGLEANSVINCDHVYTIPSDALGRLVGFLLPDQEHALTRAITHAFDLES
jgi:mRNA interferase MazF